MRSRNPSFFPRLGLLLALASARPASPAPPETLFVAPGAPIVLDSGTDDGTVEAALDGGLLRPVRGSFFAPRSGDHWLAAATRDALGTLSKVRWTLVRVDAEPPTLALEIVPAPVPDGAGRLWALPGARARATARDGASGLSEVFVATGAAVASTTGPGAEAPLPRSGRALVRAWARDAVGNRTDVMVVEVVVGIPPARGEK